MPRPYYEGIPAQPAVSHIPHAASSHEQTVNIITFAEFQEGGLLENERNVSEDESILASIDESSIENDSNHGSISTKALKEIIYRS